MKKLTACLAAAMILAAGCATIDRTTQAQTEVNLAGSLTAVLTVYGLSCPLCSNNLDGQLRRIEGVEDITVDLDSGEVTLRLAPGHNVTSADLTDAVQQAGFTLKSLSRGTDEE